MSLGLGELEAILAERTKARQITTYEHTVRAKPKCLVERSPPAVSDAGCALRAKHFQPHCPDRCKWVEVSQDKVPPNTCALGREPHAQIGTPWLAGLFPRRWRLNGFGSASAAR